jgi:hypothetical protein
MSDAEKPTPAAMPACWDTRQNWREWQRLNVIARDNSSEALDHYCTDCLPGFKQQMCDEGRCGHPTVRFVQIVERQYEPHIHMRRLVRTNALRGVRHG